MRLLTPSAKSPAEQDSAKHGRLVCKARGSRQLDKRAVQVSYGSHASACVCVVVQQKCVR